MARITRRPEAETNVIDIWGHIAEDSIAEADRWIGVIGTTAANHRPSIRLADAP